MSLLVRSPDEALHALSNVWPSMGGAKYKKARRTCIAALCGSRTTEECRTAFLAASRRAPFFWRSCRGSNEALPLLATWSADIVPASDFSCGTPRELSS
ncbi:DUF982 domain-containing protein [Mycoplana sp. BE70]|uniref:DUF982 domain-containing protein n=1 Tax=Mycoplana sp. BE70 TaxID=2817775 RepID=UPI0038620C03